MHIFICSAYYVFVSTFYVTIESLGSAYKQPSLESFCDDLIREKYNLVQIGLIISSGTSNKSLVVQQNINPRIPRSNILTTTTSKTRVPNPLH
jgi:hypothetical protein